LNGTGFVKISGTTISYDNSTYLTTGTAASTYLPLAGGTLTGALNGTTATFGSTNGIITANRSTTSFASLFKMSTAGVDNWSIGIPTLSTADWVLFNHATGISNLSFASATGAATFSSSVTASSLIKSGGTSSEFLKADGSVDSSSYLTTSSAASTYVTLATAQTITALKTFSTSSVEMAIFNSTFATGGVLAFSRNGVGVGNIGNSGSLTVGVLDDFEIRSGSAKKIHLRTDATQFTLSPSGGATLFSADSSTPLLILNTTGTNQPSGIGTQQNGTNKWAFGTNFGSGDDSWNVYNYAAASRFLTIASTGAATFSSTISATGTIRTDGASNGILLRNGFTAEIVNPTNNTRDIQFNQDTNATVMFKGNGNVGIGTASPANPLVVQGSTSIPQFRIIRSEQTTQGFTILAGGGNTVFNSIEGSNVVYGSYTFNSTKGTDTIERMRIGETQTIIYGSGNTLFVTSNNNSLSLAVGYQGVAHGYIGGINSRLEGYSNNGGYVFLNSSSVWVAASDIKRKRNFEEYTLGINAIMGLKPTLYNMDFQEDGDEKQVGFIAQEVKDFIPIAYEENDDFIGLNYNAIIVTMVKAIQELKTEIDSLKNQIK
jgi:hypothetical protein